MQIQPVNFSDLDRYCTIPITFLVESALDVSGDSPGPFSLLEQPVAKLAVLWDIRIAPGYRGQGLGRQLFDAATSWAQSRHCLEMQVETQNINVTACRFYQSMGCTLIRITRDAYNECPGEHQLIWSKQLPRDNEAF